MAVNANLDCLEPRLKRKVLAVVADVNAWLENNGFAGWQLGVFETSRTLAQQKVYLARGTTHTLKSKHIPDAQGVVHAADVVFVSPQGNWSWGNGGHDPRWGAVMNAKKAHNVAAKGLEWDKPHCQDLGE